MKCSTTKCAGRTTLFPAMLFNRRAALALAALSLVGLTATSARAQYVVPIIDNGAAAPTVISAASQLDFGGGTYNLDPNKDFSNNAGDPGQTFTSSVSGLLSSLTLKGGGNYGGVSGSSGGNFQVQISSVNTTTGALTSLATFASFSSPVTGSSDFFTFNDLQAAHIQLTAGSTYAYDFFSNQGYFGLARSNGDTYAGGNAFNSNGPAQTYATGIANPPGYAYDRTFQVGVSTTPQYTTTITDNGATTPTGGDLVQLDSSGTPNGSQDFSDNNGPGQTFTPTSTITLKSLTLKGNGGAGNQFEQGNFNLSISSVGHDGTTLTELAQFAAPAAPLNPSAGSPINNNDYFTFNNLSQAGITLNAGQQYAFAVSTDKGYFGLAASATDVLPNGAAYNSTSFAFDGEATNTHGYDRTFVINSTTAAPEPSQWAGLGFTAFGALGLMLKARQRKAAPKAV